MMTWQNAYGVKTKSDGFYLGNQSIRSNLFTATNKFAVLLVSLPSCIGQRRDLCGLESSCHLLLPV